MARIIIPLFLLALFSCNPRPAANMEGAKESLRDSILKRHLAIVRGIPYYDTFSADFQLLKAYYSNDSNSLVKNDSAFEKRISRHARRQKFYDSCTGQLPLSRLNCIQAYRFEYHGPICSFITTLTIVHYQDSTVLHTLVFVAELDQDTSKIVTDYSIRLDSTKWADFEERLNGADFWGLKEENGNSGIDGSNLWVYGYTKESNWEPARYQYVHRWSPISGIRDCFEWLLKLSKCKTGCLTIR
jgi:hypothetical protein